MAEEEYRIFTEKLIPGQKNILGVRLPQLHKLAKRIAKGEFGDWREFLSDTSVKTFEEIKLQGMVIGCAKMDFDERLEWIREFVPRIDNWSICDGFCSGLKITKNHREQMYDLIVSFLESDREYEIRFGVVMLLCYYTDEEYALRAFEHFDRIRHEGYYVKMAVAWAVSIYFVRLTEQTMEYLKDNKLDDFTYHKALQKIIESYQVAAETKKMIRGMKRRYA